MKTTLKQAHYNALTVLTVILWEFFSFFGMRALLILYLTQQLHFPDTQANDLYGNYLALVFLTPVIGGWIADYLLGYKRAIIIGCLLIILGHTTLSLSQTIGLYAGLTWLILGMGFFKTNAICLMSDCYEDHPSWQDNAYIWYYIFANLGATLGPIFCALVAHHYGWHWGFSLAGLGMLMGFIIFISRYHYLQPIGNPPGHIKQLTWLLLALGIILAFTIFISILMHHWAVWLLIVIGLAVTLKLIIIYRQSNEQLKKALWQIALLTLAGTAFWIFDQQGGSSISLFIKREVSRQISNWTVPTPWFQSINPAVIILGGPLVAFILRKLKQHQIQLSAIIKVTLGFALTGIGFSLLITGHLWNASQTNMLWVITGLTCIGVAELFIDPVVLSAINQSAPSQHRGFLTALYYLFVGAYANYLSIYIANLSVYLTEHANRAAGSGYIKEFSLVALACILIMIVLFISQRWFQLDRL